MADKSPLAEHFVDALPQAAARILEAHPPVDVSGFVDRIPDPLSGKALANMLPYYAAKSIESLPQDRAAKYLSTLPTQRVASILRHLAPERRRPVLDALPRSLSVRVGLLLNHSPRTVGAWMDPSPPSVSGNLTVAEAIRRLREHDGRLQPEAFVVDDDEEPTGVFALAELAWSEPEKSIAALARPVTHNLTAGTTLATASRHTGWDNSDRLPVVDRAGRLVGVLRHAALRSGIRRELESGSGPAREGDALELTGLWYQGLAGMLVAALAQIEAERPSDTAD